MVRVRVRLRVRVRVRVRVRANPNPNPNPNLEGLAAHVLEVGGDVLEASELGAQMVSHRTRRALLEPVAPRGHEVVEDVRARTERDPVLLAEGVELHHVPAI